VLENLAATPQSAPRAGSVAAGNVFARLGAKRAALLAISPELEECSRVSGGSWWTTLRRVTLPLARHGIVAGWLLLFIVFVREFGMSLLPYSTGTETMSVALFSLLRNNATSAAALSLVLTAILLGAVAVLRRVSRGNDYL